MAQFARPNGASVNTGGFTISDWQKIDESVASDADRAFSTDGAVAELEVGLSSVTDPGVSTGHVLRFRVAQTDDGVASGTGSASTLGVRLLQGTTVIWSDASTPLTGAWATRTVTLSGAEADAITDYTDLRIEFAVTGGGGSPANRRGAGVSWAELEVPDASVTVSPGLQSRPLTAAAPTRVDQTVGVGAISRPLSPAAPAISSVLAPGLISPLASLIAPARIDVTAHPPLAGQAAATVAPTRIDRTLAATLISAAMVAQAPDVRFSVNPGAIAMPAAAAAPRIDQQARPALVSIPATVATPAIGVAVSPVLLSAAATAAAPARVDQVSAPSAIVATASAIAFSRVDAAVAAVLVPVTAGAAAPTIQEEGALTVSPAALGMAAGAVAPSRLDQAVAAQLLAAAAAVLAPSVTLPGQTVSPAALSAPLGPVAFVRVDQGISPAEIATAAATVAPGRIDQQLVAELIAAAIGALAPDIADVIVTGGSAPHGSAQTFVAVGLAGPVTSPSGSASHSTPEH